MTRVWTTYGVGNSESMDATAFLVPNPRKSAARKPVGRFGRFPVKLTPNRTTSGWLLIRPQFGGEHAVRYNPSAWLPAPAAGRYVLRTPVCVLPAGVPFPFPTRRPWSQVALLPDLHQLLLDRTRRKAEDSRRARFSSSGIGSSLCWAAAAWAKSTALRISSSGNVVALKFLPASLQNDTAALAGFHAEVRNARQVSHPNVCRVYDIGEVNGQHFLTMEYIDGEDLSSLLRRIGRLPPDKALETAHQICAGLAAAHDCGLLHRDLKPANIMLDGRGRVRITDFGLALSSDDATGRSETAGTPAYMAPEQIGKGEASVRSDIYSLGLVFYELFTGHLPYQANTAVEWRRAHLESSPKTPSSVVKDIDPAVESAILRCLQKDPAKRPSSVRQVAAAFPGGDPLAAALAAGETPSPEMVAASGETEGLRPVVAWAVLAGVIVSVIAAILLSAQTMLYRRVPLEKPPEALAERARDILQSVGYSEPPVDTAMGFYEGNEFLRYIAEHDKSKTRWDNLETGAFVFWYRGSPRPLAAGNIFSETPIRGSRVDGRPAVGCVRDDTGQAQSAAVALRSSSQFLRRLRSRQMRHRSPDWAPLFSAAGLDMSKWPPAQPMWTPPVYSDARAAWTGSLAERPDIPMRIEAAAYRGKPVYFELIGPWTRAERMQPYQQTAGERASLVICIVLLLSVLVGRRNARPAQPAPRPG